MAGRFWLRKGQITGCNFQGGRARGVLPALRNKSCMATIYPHTILMIPSQSTFAYESLSPEEAKERIVHIKVCETLSEGSCWAGAVLHCRDQK